MYKNCNFNRDSQASVPSLASPAPSLEEEGSGALPVHELFFAPRFLGNKNIHEIQLASTATDTCYA